MQPPSPPASPKMLEARAIRGVSEMCPKCKGKHHRQKHCKYCDYRGVVVGCESCSGTGLIPTERAVYNVVHCIQCGQNGFRPAKFAEMGGTIVPNKFCRHCGSTGKHVLVPHGSVCSACNKNSMG